MAIDLEWESKQLLSMRYKGMVLGVDLLSVTLQISGDPRFDDLRYILSDWSNVKKTDVSVKDVKVLVAYATAMARTNDKIMNATVISEDEKGQALAAFYKDLTADISWQIKYFTNEPEARNWFMN